MKMILIIMSILMVSHSHATETGLLMNAKKAIPSDYPEVVLISSSVGQCTASIIGPHVLVSAGHCALTGKSVEFTFKGKKMKASGGIRTYEDAEKMIKAGASRIGASASVSIVTHKSEPKKPNLTGKKPVKTSLY